MTDFGNADKVLAQASLLPDEVKKIMDDTDKSIEAVRKMSSGKDADRAAVGKGFCSMQIMRLDLLFERYNVSKKKAEELIESIEKILVLATDTDEGVWAIKKSSLMLSEDMLRQNLLVIAAQSERVKRLRDSLADTDKAIRQSSVIRQNDLAMRIVEALRKT